MTEKSLSNSRQVAGADPVLSVVERPLNQPEKFDKFTLDTRYTYMAFLTIMKNVISYSLLGTRATSGSLSPPGTLVMILFYLISTQLLNSPLLSFRLLFFLVSFYIFHYIQNLLVFSHFFFFFSSSTISKYSMIR